jgi:hypothetical protein
LYRFQQTLAFLGNRGGRGYIIRIYVEKNNRERKLREREQIQMVKIIEKEG